MTETISLKRDASFQKFMEYLKKCIIEGKLSEKILDVLKKNDKLLKYRYVGGNTLLHIAAGYGKSLSLRALLSQSKEGVNEKNAQQRTPLFEAVAEGSDREDIKCLHKAGANVNTQDSNQDTPLHIALRGKRDEVAKLLLELGADVNLQNSKKNTSLHEAILSKKLDLVKMVYEKGGKLNIKNIENKTPRAIKSNNKIAQYLRSKNKQERKKEKRTEMEDGGPVRKRKRSENKSDISIHKDSLLGSPGIQNDKIDSSVCESGSQPLSSENNHLISPIQNNGNTYNVEQEASGTEPKGYITLIPPLHNPFDTVTTPSDADIHSLLSNNNFVLPMNTNNDNSVLPMNTNNDNFVLPMNTNNDNFVLPMNTNNNNLPLPMITMDPVPSNDVNRAVTLSKDIQERGSIVGSEALQTFSPISEKEELVVIVILKALREGTFTIPELLSRILSRN